MTSQTDGSVELADGESASSILFEVLTAAVAQFPEALRDVQLPATQQAFRKDYPQCLPRFEAVRLASNQRLDIARHLVESTGKRLVWRVGNQELALPQRLEKRVDPLVLRRVETATGGWSPNLIYRGERWPATELADYADHLVSRNMITPAAGSALTWLQDNVLLDGRLHLTDRKIVVMGANAEMAASRSWLESGASVLWLDVAAPPLQWIDSAHPIGFYHRLLSSYVSSKVSSKLASKVASYYPSATAGQSAHWIRFTIPVRAALPQLPSSNLWRE